MRNEVLKFLYYRFNLDDDKAEEQEIIESIRRSVEFRGTNLWALIFAILIASIGLNVNSTAVIIGAMLISPIMGPIMGVGLGLGIFDTKLIRHGMKNYLIAVVISLVTSTIYFLLTPLSEAQSELLARTRPTIWDVLIALAGGLAGVIASTRKDVSNTIPGVAIATALMPPLCTAGYGLANGNLPYFAGAFYLFIINSVFISIATFLIIRFLKFKQKRLPDPARESILRRSVWTVAGLTIIPSVYLAVVFVNEEFFKQRTRRFINTELRAYNLYVLDRTIEPMRKNVHLVVYGADLTDSVLSALDRSKEKFGLGDVRISLEKAKTDAVSVREFAAMRTDLERQLLGEVAIRSEQENRIKFLETALEEKNKPVMPPGLQAEFTVLFGEVREFAATKAPVYTGESADTFSIIYVAPNRQRIDEKKVIAWLQARLNTEKVKCIVKK